MQKSLILTSVLLVSGTMLMAQSKEKDQKAEQQAAMEAEMKAKKEMLEEQEQQMKQIEYQYAEQARSAERSARASARSSGRSSSRLSYGTNAYVVAPGDNSDYFFYSGASQSTQTQLTLRNSFDGTSNSSKGQFEVDENTRHFRVMINGKVKSGKIRIIVDYPNGDTFKDLVINSAAEITFSQSVSISEEDPDKYIGDWNYKVIAEEAKGNYLLQIQTH